ncbi:hypothetical protein [Thiomicrorhabdus sp.]|uniref:hypothetical protein n=1 Tax=Thiomicrorhabdus sp. TaxID=2039724 RepID=UPI0029C619FF|nr:hypothetical protein [Thiomicrorhabdus sp.]
MHWGLKSYLAGIVLFIGVGLVVGYTFLAGSFFKEGIDTYTVSQMYRMAENFRSSDGREGGFNRQEGFVVSGNWSEFPQDFQQTFQLSELKDNILHKQMLPENPPSKGHLLFVLKVSGEHQSPVFVGREFKPSEIPQIGIEKAGRSFMFLHLVGGVILLVLIGRAVLASEGGR